MEDKKVKTFMQLGGQPIGVKEPSFADKKLGAQLLLSELLEYIIKGLGVTPVINGQTITDTEAIEYKEAKPVSRVEMLDGLADVAYTMYWNALKFNLPLEAAYDAVCDNNLEKFVRLDGWKKGTGTVAKSDWTLGLNVTWPPEVETVEVLCVDGVHYAAGKNAMGKVRKPSTYRPVDLEALAAA
jgi:hypothetical protein